VLLTSPLETFSVGNTIVLSRVWSTSCRTKPAGHGAIHELAHIALGRTWQQVRLQRPDVVWDETTYANWASVMTTWRAIGRQEGSGLLKNSPYAQKLDSAGLFLRMLSARGEALPGLLTLTWKPIAVNGTPTRLTDIMNALHN